MPKLRVNSFAISLDGYGAGPGQNLDNPLGVDPEDPNGQDDVIIANPIVHLPLDQPVKALLRSTDVLHNFAVAEFRVKMDLVPGLVTYLWFTPTRTGTY